MIWKPHVTVAAIIKEGQQFLLVEESIGGKAVFNQPAGHLEAGESLPDALIREVFEETGYDFNPESLVGTYLWTVPETERTYLRFTMAGSVGNAPDNPQLDKEIIRACWMSVEEIKHHSEQLRSPLVQRSLNDYLNGSRHSLDLLRYVS